MASTRVLSTPSSRKPSLELQTATPSLVAHNFNQLVDSLASSSSDSSTESSSSVEYSSEEEESVSSSPSPHHQEVGHKLKPELLEPALNGQIHVTANDYISLTSASRRSFERARKEEEDEKFKSMLRRARKDRGWKKDIYATEKLQKMKEKETKFQLSDPTRSPENKKELDLMKLKKPGTYTLGDKNTSPKKERKFETFASKKLGKQSFKGVSEPLLSSNRTIGGIFKTKSDVFQNNSIRSDDKGAPFRFTDDEESDDEPSLFGFYRARSIAPSTEHAASIAGDMISLAGGSQRDVARYTRELRSVSKSPSKTVKTMRKVSKLFPLKLSPAEEASRRSLRKEVGKFLVVPSKKYSTKRDDCWIKVKPSKKPSTFSADLDFLKTSNSVQLRKANIERKLSKNKFHPFRSQARRRKVSANVTEKLL